jgi:hypothetical protein
MLIGYTLNQRKSHLLKNRNKIVSWILLNKLLILVEINENNQPKFLKILYKPKQLFKTFIYK